MMVWMWYDCMTSVWWRDSFVCECCECIQIEEIAKKCKTKNRLKEPQKISLTFKFFCNISPNTATRGFPEDIPPGAPPAPVRLSGQNFFEEKFSPFQWTGRWKFATNGGSSRHFYTHLNALKTARIESREDSKTHSVAKIGENGVFFVKRARCNPRFSH